MRELGWKYSVPTGSIRKAVKEGNIPLRRPKKHPQELVDKIARLYTEGKTTREISEIVNQSMIVVAHIRDRRTNVKAKRKKAVPFEKAFDVCKKYEAGMSCKELGIEFGCDRRTISSLLAKHGIKLRTKRKIPITEHTKIYELKNLDNLSREEIAEMYGVSRSTINKILTDYKRQRIHKG